MSDIVKVLHTAKTATTGGRHDGTSRSSDGLLDIRLSTPGTARIGTNPEQLLAAGWSASFANAIVLAAHNKKIVLPAKVSIDAEVDLKLGNGGYSLTARFIVTVPGIERSVAKDLVAQAENICPCAKATRGNIEVTIKLV
jgi:osmotically inducible protein OsmC